MGNTSSMAKVMVSIPDDLLARVDNEAHRRATSRSALLAAAVERELDRRDPASVDAAVERSRARFRRAGPFESADLLRAERDSRP